MRLFIAACLIASQCQGVVFAQSFASASGGAGPETVFRLQPQRSRVLWDVPRIVTTSANETDPASPPGVRGSIKAAALTAAAHALAAPAAKAQTTAAQGSSKNRTLMWILIGAGAGGAVAAVALLKSNDSAGEEPTVTLGTVTVGAP